MVGEQLDAFGKVAVLFGGNSAEREISLLSGHAVLTALQSQGVNAIGMDVSESLIRQLEDLNPDRVFIVLHGAGGEDGTIQGALEFLGLPYTGSGVMASALAMDKLRCKQLWQGIGLPTAAFAVLTKDSHWQDVLQNLGGTVMVKPVREGSSIGMAKAAGASELEAAWQEASRYEGPVIAEAWLAGDEYTVAVIDGVPLPAIRVEIDNGFYDYQAKYFSDETRYLCPCGLSPEQEARLQTLCLEAFDSLDCTGWGRVDVMMDSDGNFQLLEVNTVPGMTSHSLVPMAAQAIGLTFEQLVVKILVTTMEGSE